MDRSITAGQTDIVPRGRAVKQVSVEGMRDVLHGGGRTVRFGSRLLGSDCPKNCWKGLLNQKEDWR